MYKYTEYVTCTVRIPFSALIHSYLLYCICTCLLYSKAILAIDCLIITSLEYEHLTGPVQVPVRYSYCKSCGGGRSRGRPTDTSYVPLSVRFNVQYEFGVTVLVYTCIVPQIWRYKYLFKYILEHRRSTVYTTGIPVS